MNLSKLLEGVSVIKLYQGSFGKVDPTEDLRITGIHYDSRKLAEGGLFAAIRGTEADGHRYIPEALARGARAVLVEEDGAVPDSVFKHHGAAKIVVRDSRRALAEVAGNYFGHPSRKLRLVGVTGTNGKTTTTYLIRSVLEASGARTGLIGTIEYWIGKNSMPAVHTTPESVDLNKLLRQMADDGCTSAVMEVSSHALAQQRVFGLDFDCAVFTNLTQDHLDYHGTMEGYLGAKKRLFDSLGSGAVAVYNSRDPAGERMVGGTAARKISFGGPGSDVELKSSSPRYEGSLHVGTDVVLEHERETVAVHSPLIGDFNSENLAASAAACFGLGMPVESIREGISRVENVPGRFEKILSPRGFTVIVDYAHTPDALDRCLRSIRLLLEASRSENRGRVITVFGCGGNRDRAKRPVMGRIAAQLSDVTIVTSDNPRHEEPDSIIDEVMQGIPSASNVKREPQRRKAIELSLREARAGDVVLIAGKGHETVQVIGDARLPFDDRAVVRQLISG